MAEPTKGIINQLFARIRNLGDTPIDVRVRFFYSPFGMGYLHRDFKEIGVTLDTRLEAAGAVGDIVSVSVPWDLSDLTENFGGLWPAPIQDFDHFCVRVVIEEVTAGSDVNTDNNTAQNNFVLVPTRARGRPRTLTFVLANPDKKRSVEARIVTQGLLPGWKLEVKDILQGTLLKDRFHLRAGEKKVVSATVVPSATPDEKKKVHVVDLSLLINGERVGGLSLNLTAPN